MLPAQKLRKMGCYSFVAVTATAISLLASHPTRAQSQEKSPFSFDVSVGAEYDSNITVDELDQETGEDDIAAIIEAEAEYKKGLSENTDIAVSYSFSQSLHDEFTDFDLQSHFASIDLVHDFGSFDLGGAYRFVYASLGGDGFLTFQQLSPYVSSFLSEKLFVRAEYSYTDKAFKNRIDRDSDVHAFGADLYYFINGVRTYLVFGYKFETEDAVASQFDFDGHNFKVRLSQRFKVAGRDAQLKLSWRYEARNYSGITPSIGVERDDDRHRLQADLELPISDRFYTAIEYTYTNFSSNLAAADYTQNLLTARLGYRF
ncbi:MAG: hypothetical protein Tsb0016_20180 [Sphingomonadales bacterium]